MNEIMINGQALAVKEYEGKRVITLKEIDKFHERPEGTARKRFNDNKKHFIEGEDFFRITPSEFRTAIGEMDARQQKRRHPHHRERLPDDNEVIQGRSRMEDPP